MSGNKAYGHFMRLGVTHLLVNVILLLESISGSESFSVFLIF